MRYKRKPNTRQVALIVGLLAVASWMPVGSAAAEVVPGKPVSLYVNVEQGDKLIEGLEPGNFRLYEENHSVPFRLEEPEAPASIALLVEYSQSSYPYFLQDIANAIQGFDEAAPDGNWYALATFAHDLDVQVDFTKQKELIPNTFKSLGDPIWNETDTYDAICNMLDKITLLPGRRVLIFIGTGFDSFSQHSASDVQKRLESTDVTVYALAAGTLLRGQYNAYLDTSQSMDLIQAESFIRMMSDKTGGEAWFPRFDSAFSDDVKGLFQDLNTQYRLVYTPSFAADGKFHKIKVDAFQVVDDRRQEFKVRVREGWRF